MKAQITTPMSRDDPNDVRFEEIPLPPPEMWPDLDNGGGAAPAAAAPASTAAKPSAPQGGREREALNFQPASDRHAFQIVPLTFAFTHDLYGSVTEIRVRRLTVGEVGDLLDNRPADAPDLFDIYAQMTDFTAPILRGLIDIDGEAVTAVCYDFLPRLFRAARTEPPEPSSTLPAGDR